MTVDDASVVESKDAWLLVVVSEARRVEVGEDASDEMGLDMDSGVCLSEDEVVVLGVAKGVVEGDGKEVVRDRLEDGETEGKRMRVEVESRLYKDMVYL